MQVGKVKAKATSSRSSGWQSKGKDKGKGRGKDKGAQRKTRTSVEGLRAEARKAWFFDPEKWGRSFN